MEDVTAIVTLFNPDDEAIQRLNHYSEIFTALIVIDNSNDDYVRFRSANCTYLNLTKNRGLSIAINEAMAFVESKYLFLMDQDTEFTKEVISGLYLALKIADVDAICPVFSNENSVNAIGDISPVELAPTSGILLKMRYGFERLYDDKFFVDFCDFTFCLNLVSKHGVGVYRANGITVHQHLGESTGKLFHLEYHIPSPFRHYFQFRDTLNLVFKYRFSMRSKLRLLILLPIKFVVYPFILNDGLNRFKFMTMGLRDFFLQKTGVGSLKFLEGDR